mgnify:CR=1 FL=1
MKTLTIISHTEHYKNADDGIVGLGSTVTEINNLLTIFDAIIHVGMFHNSPAPASALPYASNKITFIPLPAVGGPKVLDKLAIIWKAPSILMTIHKAINQTDYFQFRAPTGIGVFVIPYLMVWRSKKGWFKYAGNWKQQNAPLAYSLQRWLLTKQKRYVTINGKWENQPKSCITFENPCLTINEVQEGLRFTAKISFNNTEINFCFVGRLEEEKGIGLLINAFNNLTKDEKLKIGTIHIVGHGLKMSEYKAKASKTGLNFNFHGFLSRTDVHEIYKVSHAIVLPSASEGFPKVIAEAMNYGCLPIVSDISSLRHYIKNEQNGFLFYPITENEIVKLIRKLLSLNNFQYSNMIQVQQKELSKFTYTYYNHRILKEIANSY